MSSLLTVFLAVTGAVVLSGLLHAWRLRRFERRPDAGGEPPTRDSKFTAAEVRRATAVARQRLDDHDRERAQQLLREAAERNQGGSRDGAPDGL